MDKECFFFSHEDMARVLRGAPQQGKNTLEPLKTLAQSRGIPFKVLEDTACSNEAEVHETEGDVWLYLQGEVWFEYGGALVDPRKKKEHEWGAQTIAGGKTITLKEGDWFWIPPGVPHRHGSVGTARLIIIKIPAV